MRAPVAFVDTETVGLDWGPDVIWEFAAIRREPDGREDELHLFIEHNEALVAAMPEEFRTDHDARYPADGAMSRARAARAIAMFLGPDSDGIKTHSVGADPQIPRRTGEFDGAGGQRGAEPAAAVARVHVHVRDLR